MTKVKNTTPILDILKSIQIDIAALRKAVSSIEMELLIQRGACLDNNFEGKEDM